MLGVWAERCGIFKDTGWYIDPRNLGSGWRVCFCDDKGRAWALSKRFARERDALMAIAALEKAGYTVRDLNNSPLGDDEPWEGNNIILEAMQW